MKTTLEEIYNLNLNTFFEDFLIRTINKKIGHITISNGIVSIVIDDIIEV